MKVAVISDIHSNYHAFKAVYEDAMKNNATNFIFLGDYVSDLAEGKKTLDLLYEIKTRHPTYCVSGNRERYMLEHHEFKNQFQRGSSSGSLLYTYENLRTKDFAFFQSLDNYAVIEIGGVKFEIAHAIKGDDRYLFSNNFGDIDTVFMNMRCDFLLTGHSHKQYSEVMNGKTIINPGSAGVPQNKKLQSEYAILDIEDGRVNYQLCSVPYDIKATIEAQFESGLVTYAKFWAIGVLYDIITGENWIMKLLRLASQKSPNPSEDDWLSAALELGMPTSKAEILAFYEDNLKS